MRIANKKLFAGCVAMMLVVSAIAYAQGTVFTYQGKLMDGGNVANGNYDMQFNLYDTVNTGTGTQQGSTLTMANVAVSSGIFSVQLDLGACATCFDGNARYLEIAVKKTSDSGYTTLSPRQLVTSTPYAIRSMNATMADGLSVACINCVTNSQIQSVSVSAVTGSIPVASVPDLGASYIKNTTSQQATSNFNISGTGTAATFNATTQYNISGNRVLSVPGTNNLFAGSGAGQSNTSGASNAFVGAGAGQANTIGANTLSSASTPGATTLEMCLAMAATTRFSARKPGRATRAVRTLSSDEQPARQTRRVVSIPSSATARVKGARANLTASSGRVPG